MAAARTPDPMRNVEAGALLIGLGALLLFVGLFLDWYQPGLDAWTVFEAWDLVLALLAVAALVAVAGRMGFGPPRPAAWLLGPAIAALIIVLYAILDPPPSIAGIEDGDPATGLWLALAGAVLMTIGAVLSVARISVAITTDRAAAPAAVPHGGGRGSRGTVADDDPLTPGAGVPPRDPTDPTRRL